MDDGSPVIGKPTVYVIDDDPAVRRLIEHLLSREGLHVETFDSAPAFLLHYQSGRGTCILVNVDMPAMSGIELVKTLQSDPYAPRLLS